MVPDKLVLKLMFAEVAFKLVERCCCSMTAAQTTAETKRAPWRGLDRLVVCVERALEET